MQTIKNEELVKKSKTMKEKNQIQLRTKIKSKEKELIEQTEGDILLCMLTY